MSATTHPLPGRQGGRGKSAPSTRDIERHLVATFPGLTRGAANRTARAAAEVQSVRPDVDILAWAENDIVRRRHAGMPIMLGGFDPTWRQVRANLKAQGRGDSAS